MKRRLITYRYLNDNNYGNNNSYTLTGEFHENIKIKMLKAYFRDLSGLTEFNLSYFSQILDDELHIKDFTKKNQTILTVTLNNDCYIYSENSENYNQKKKKKLKSPNPISERSETNNSKYMSNEKQDVNLYRNNRNSVQNTDINNIEAKSTEIENKEEVQSLNIEILILKKENLSYKALNEDLERKNSNLTKSNLQLNKINEDLESKLTDYDSLLLKYNSLVSKDLKRQSLKITNTSTFIEETNKDNINENKLSKSQNLRLSIKRRESILKRNSLINEKEKINIISNKQINRVSKIEEKKDININKLNLNLEEKNKNVFNNKSLNIINAVNNIKHLNEWVKILDYLSKTDKLNFAKQNKERFKILNFHFNENENKEKHLINLIKEYSTLNKEIKFEIGVTTISALKLLNTEKYLEVFKDYNNLKDNRLQIVYKLLTKLANLFEMKEEDNFIFKFCDYILLTSKSQKIGDYLKCLNFNLDIDNILEIIKLIKKSNLKSIETGLIGKLERTTGIISFLVKDILVYLGLDLNEKEKNEKKLEIFGKKRDIISQIIKVKY